MLYEKIKEEAKANKTTVAEIERHCKFARGSIAKWNENVPSADKLVRVADYLHIPFEELINAREYGDERYDK